MKTSGFIQVTEAGVTIRDTHNAYDVFSVNYFTSPSFYIQTLFEGANSATTTSSFYITDFQLTFTYLGTSNII